MITLQLWIDDKLHWEQVYAVSTNKAINRQAKRVYRSFERIIMGRRWCIYQVRWLTCIS